MISDQVIIHPTAEIGKNVTIGPWSIIEENVVIGDDTEIGTHVVIGRNTKIGNGNSIYSHVCLGTDPQHKDYKKIEQTWLEIGNNNIIREFVTVNRGTKQGSQITRVGNSNYLMAYSHIAHDCKVGNRVIFGNAASIAGHVEVGDYAVVGPFCGAHQFCRIGDYSFLCRDTKIYRDILPYMLVTGNPGVPRGLNIVGLRRHGFDGETMRSLKQAFRLLYRKNYRLSEICIELEKLAVNTPEINKLLAMIMTSARGIARSRDDNTELEVLN